MFVASWNGFVENRQFRNHGQKALVEPIGEYTETTTTRTQLGIEVGQSKSHSAALFFTTLDKQRLRVNRHIPDDVLNTFLSGGDVCIEYLPDAPSTTRFLGHSSSPVLSALLGLLTVAVTWLFWRKL
jgi:hypothetical protein